jgi:hypothetical protein
MFLSKSAVTKVQAIVMVAVILVAAILISAFIMQASPTAGPSPSPAPTPTTAPPSPSSSPTPTTPPYIWPPSFLPEIYVEVVSLEGFDYTKMSDIYPKSVPVLHQGTSANITLTLLSREKKSYNASFSVSESSGKELEGINCMFHPPFLNLTPNERVNLTLTLEVSEDASNNLYHLDLGIKLKEDLGFGLSLDFQFLVFPYVPSHIFYVFFDDIELPTPWEPEIQVQRGEAHILFYIDTEMENPSLTLNLTYQSGALPEGIRTEIAYDPLKVVPSNLSYRFKSLLLTVKVDPETPEGIYEIIAKGTVNQKTFERAFKLKVMSGPVAERYLTYYP